MEAENKETGDLMLERHLLGELPPEEESRLRDALKSDEVLRSRLEALEKSNREILEEYPPERMAALIRDKMAGPERERPATSRPRQPARNLAWPVGIAAMLLITLSFFTLRSGLAPALFDSGKETVRVKGGAPHLMVFRKNKLNAEQLVDGSMAKKGDILQIGYETGSLRYGAIVSIDGRGGVTFHLPASYGGSQQTAPKLDPSGQVLPSAYELDDAPSFERFFFVYSTEPFDLRIVWQAAQGLAANSGEADRGTLQLPKTLHLYSFIVRKEGTK
jgi:hypothetical protein